MDQVVSLIYATNAILCLVMGVHIVSAGYFRNISTIILGINCLVYACQYALGVSIFLWDWEPALYIRPVTAMMIGPSYYFYYYSLVQPGSLWKARHFLHFIPALFVVYIIVSKNYALINIDFLIQASFLVYTISILVVIFRGPSVLKHLESDAKLAFRWLCILAGLIVISTLSEISINIEVSRGTEISSSKFLLIGSIVFLIFNITVVLLLLKRTPMIDWMFKVVESGLRFYKGSGLTDENRNHIYKQWQVLVEQQEVYKQEGGITLKDAAKMLGIPARHLSESINYCYQGNFSQYLNDTRIKMAQQLMSENPSMPITTIMFEVGFNSKSGFNKEFMRIVGMSPSKFRQQCLNEL